MAQSSLRIMAFVLALVGGILGLVEGLRPFRFGLLPRDLSLDLILLLIGGGLAIAGAVRGNKGAPRDAGAMAIVGGILVLLAGPDLAGALAIAGGVLFLVE